MKQKYEGTHFHYRTVAATAAAAAVVATDAHETWIVVDDTRMPSLLVVQCDGFSLYFRGTRFVGAYEKKGGGKRNRTVWTEAGW